MTKIHAAVGSRLTDGWVEQLQALPTRPRVVFPEGSDPRIVAATDQLAGIGIQPIRILDASEAQDDSGMSTGSSVLTLPQALRTLRAKERGEVEARQAGSDNVDEIAPWVGMGMMAAGAADACVVGARATSSSVIRAALRVIGLRVDTRLSSAFLLELPDDRVIAFADCAVNIEPSADELAAIAIATARTFADLTNERPVVALLGFSTKGSAEHSSLLPLREAVASVRAQMPELIIDGEIQFDAAITPAVAKIKAHTSPVAGAANVLIFPNLHAANIGYKIAQRLSGATAVGPLLQGLRAPVNDLSRGSSVSDIVAVGLATALQVAQHHTDHPK